MIYIEGSNTCPAYNNIYSDATYWDVYSVHTAIFMNNKLEICIPSNFEKAKTKFK